MFATIVNQIKITMNIKDQINQNTLSKLEKIQDLDLYIGKKFLLEKPSNRFYKFKELSFDNNSVIEINNALQELLRSSDEEKAKIYKPFTGMDPVYGIIKSVKFGNIHWEGEDWLDLSTPSRIETEELNDYLSELHTNPIFVEHNEFIEFGRRFSTYSDPTTFGYKVSLGDFDLLNKQTYEEINLFRVEDLQTTKINYNKQKAILLAYIASTFKKDRNLELILNDLNEKFYDGIDSFRVILALENEEWFEIKSLKNKRKIWHADPRTGIIFIEYLPEIPSVDFDHRGGLDDIRIEISLSDKTLKAINNNDISLEPLNTYITSTSRSGIDIKREYKCGRLILDTSKAVLKYINEVGIKVNWQEIRLLKLLILREGRILEYKELAKELNLSCYREGVINTYVAKPVNDVKKRLIKLLKHSGMTENLIKKVIEKQPNLGIKLNCKFLNN